MISSGQMTAQYFLRLWPGRGGRIAFVVLVNIAQLACSTSYSSARLVAQVPPLQLGDHRVTPDEVRLRAPTPGLLELDQDMREFVQRYTAGIHHDPGSVHLGSKIERGRVGV